ncbi:MAG: nicotinate phosphoribosyltransferase [Acidimicrobiales bacterium]|nr:nicotinate phosphoribosyltransferase [Acidimicrobiales bacterium]
MTRPGELVFTDLYELTMAAAYEHAGKTGRATFDLFVRSLPEPRNFLVAAGLAEALDHLEALHVTDTELDHLRTLEWVDDGFLDLLANLRFTGEVFAVPEGEVVFGGEPILRVTAPLIEAQVVETRLLNLVASQTMIASKAARIAIACGDRRFVEFGSRRTHGGDAGMQAARSSWIGGAAGTSLVSAGVAYDLPLSGTMAHSFIMSFDDEADAYRAFARRFPDGAVLLIDTYDTEEGARLAVQVAHELADEGVRIGGVRLDSGDLARLAKSVRRILDDGGLEHVSIFASGDLDEYRITEILATGAPIDAFGVGTQLGTSADAPSLGGVYKLVNDESGPKIKLSEDKVTLPGVKQVWRVSDDVSDRYDVIAVEGEDIAVPNGCRSRPLLEPVMIAGRRTRPDPGLDAAQQRCRDSVAALPNRMRSLQQRERPFEVRRSDRLQELIETLTRAHSH